MFSVHGGTVVGVASAAPAGHKGEVLAVAAGDVTFKFSNRQFAGESVGTGDGVTTVFPALANIPVAADSQTVYLNGVSVAETTDYTFVDATGVITFLVAPANGVVITADYLGTKQAIVTAAVGQEFNVGQDCTITSVGSVAIS